MQHLRSFQSQAINTEAFCAPPDLVDGYEADKGELEDEATSVGFSQLDSAPLQVTSLLRSHENRCN